MLGIRTLVKILYVYLFLQKNIAENQFRKCFIYLMTPSTHFIYGYMPLTSLYSFRLTTMVLLYGPSHRQDSTTTTFVTPVVEHWLEREMA